MRRLLERVALAVVLVLAGAACVGGDPVVSAGPDAEPRRGGTLRLHLVSDLPGGLDPQKEYYNVAWELYRCCLLRTLVGYEVPPAGTGEPELRPDLATDLPEVSRDGLTWTYRLKEGVTYAPPFAGREVTSGDVIRALERTADPDTASPYRHSYSMIRGFDAYASGDAERIRGLRAPDDHTLKIELSSRRPHAGFGALMALPATSPIPEGAADGHAEDYGRFLAATGPYMLAGSQERDLTPSPDEQEPAAGYDPGTSLTLVRNPSWRPGTDDLRPAWADRIEISIGSDGPDVAERIDAGELDMLLDGAAPPEQVQRYQRDPELRHRLFVHSANTIRYLTMNLAVPPFDDVHVRRAVNLALDKDSMRRIRGGPVVGKIANHVFPGPLLGGRLADYDPYATDDHRGDIEAAKKEMAQSAYDSDGDGVCDDEVCQTIPAATSEVAPFPDQATLVRQNLEPLGLMLDINELEHDAMYELLEDPRTQTALGLAPGFGPDFLDGSAFGRSLFGSDAIGPEACCNASLLGAGSGQLEDWGYEVSEVPSVDEEIAECEGTRQEVPRSGCWAKLDRHLMEEVVPWVPYLVDSRVQTVSGRVVNYTFDSFTGLPALDHIAIAGGGEEGS